MHNLYLKSISNELAIDQYVWRTIDKSQATEKPLLLPRPFKSKSLQDFLEKRNLNCLLKLLCSLWFWIPFPLLICYGFLSTLIKKAGHLAMGKATLAIRGKIAIVSGMYSFKLFSEQTFDDYLKIEVASEVTLDAGKQSIKTVLDFCSIGIIFKAFYNSFLVVIKNRRMLNCSLKLQTFVTFEWVLLYLLLHKYHSNIEEIAFTNHYDRWAVLFDGLSFKRAILFQHGILMHNAKISLPYKHKNVHVVYGFNHTAIDFFKTNVIDNDLTIYRIKERQLQLADLQKDVIGRRLLLIGTPYDQETELYVIKKILENVQNVTIYIKPHPSFGTAVYTNFSKNYPVILIQDRNLFPRVDLTLSFISTLAEEYEAIGIPNISLMNNNIEAILNKLNTESDSKNDS